MPEYKNFPVKTCAQTLKRILRQHPHSAFYQKWTCSGCGRRITANIPNQLTYEGHCEDCGAITDMRKTGCNYSMHFAIGGIADVPPKGSA